MDNVNVMCYDGELSLGNFGVLSGCLILFERRGFLRFLGRGYGE